MQALITHQLPMGAGLTAYGVGILSELYVIYMERSTSHIHTKIQVHWSIGCSRRGGYTWMDRRNHRPLFWIERWKAIMSGCKEFYCK